MANDVKMRIVMEETHDGGKVEKTVTLDINADPRLLGELLPLTGKEVKFWLSVTSNKNEGREYKEEAVITGCKFFGNTTGTAKKQ